MPWLPPPPRGPFFCFDSHFIFHRQDAKSAKYGRNSTRNIDNFLATLAPWRFEIISLSVLYDDARELGREVLLAQGQLRGHAPGDVAVDLRDAALGVRHHRGLAAVGLFADTDIERERPQEIHIVLLGHPLAAALAEDMLQIGR